MGEYDTSTPVDIPLNRKPNNAVVDKWQGKQERSLSIKPYESAWKFRDMGFQETHASFKMFRRGTANRNGIFRNIFTFGLSSRASKVSMEWNL